MKQTEKGRNRKAGLVAIAAASVLSVGFTPVFAQQKSQQPDHQINAERMVPASSLVGTHVMDSQNHEVGTISNIFVDPQTGRIQRADIHFNKRLFPSERTYSVRWDQLSFERNGNKTVATLEPSFVDRLRGASQQQNASNHQGQQYPWESGKNQQMGQNQHNQQISVADLSSADISKLQHKLNKEGFDAGHVNGKWGQDAEAALRNFQQFKGIPVTGQLDQRTVNALGLNPDNLRRQNQNNDNNGTFEQNQSNR